MNRVLVPYTRAANAAADAEHARAEEWRALHRRPDALPDPDTPVVPGVPGSAGRTPWLAGLIGGALVHVLNRFRLG
jgi:hypothetical protein